MTASRKPSSLSDDDRLNIAAGYAATQDRRLRRLCIALEQIEEGVGPYSRDPLTHAGNTIDAMRTIARDALRQIREDVAKGA